MGTTRCGVHPDRPRAGIEVALVGQLPDQVLVVVDLVLGGVELGLARGAVVVLVHEPAAV